MAPPPTTDPNMDTTCPVSHLRCDMAPPPTTDPNMDTTCPTTTVLYLT